MRKKIAAVVLAFGCMFSVPMVYYAAETETEAAEDIEIKFRGYDWLTSKDDIEKDLNDEGLAADVNYASEGDDLVVIEQSVAGLNCNTLYRFSDGGLVMGYYDIKESHTNEQLYYLDYTNLVEKLTDIYGEPVTSGEQWLGDLYEGDDGKQGMALITGDLRLLSKWEDKDKNTLTVLYEGDNYKCKGGIVYRAAAQGNEEKKNTDGL